MNGFAGQDANNGSGDPFSRFWVDLFSKMTSAGFSPSPPSQDETFRRMRQAFFDSWAKSCDEFLHSPAFLDMMKKSLDSSLAFKQEINEFLTKALHEQQMPARSDTDSIVLVLRSFEDRVLAELERLNRRVEKMETGGTGSDAAAEPKVKGGRHSSGAAR